MNLKKIIQHGNSLVVSLTKEFGKLKVKKGYSLSVKTKSDLIILCRIKDENKGVLLIDNTDYHKLKYLIKKYENKEFEEFFEEWVKETIKKYDSAWSRPFLRIK